MQKKLIIFLCIFFLLLTSVYYIPRGYQQTITIGMYAGCAIDTSPINEFRQEHPSAVLDVKSSVSEKGYKEWLARGFLDGNEPDLFVIPPEDMEKYIQLNALQELSQLTYHSSYPATENTPFYALPVPSSQGTILMGISARSKYPKLSFELLRKFCALK